MKKIFLLLPLVFFISACATSGVKYNNKAINKRTDDFYRKTRFIMSKEEREIYKHLPDQESRKEFIKDFWEKRDPTPDNGENEAKESYEERIRYANRWFRENASRGTGWETERGRILLQLGIPDRREFGEMPYIRQDGSLASTKRLPMERWYYYRYKLYLVFTDPNGFGKFKLAGFPSSLLTAIDLAKISILDNSRRGAINFKFRCRISNGNIAITIPTKKISFEEKDGFVKASFDFRIYKYLKYRRIDILKFKKEIREKKESMLSKKMINFEFPIKIKSPGKYYFDVVGEDMLSKSKYRNFCKAKIRN